VIDQIDVGSLGKRIRRHPAVGKEGANVDFVTDGRSGEIWIRTYERGVEKETLACGSGCVAAAHLLRSRGLAGDVVTLIAVSGDRLKVELPKGEGQSSYLSGPARIIYEGLIDIDI
jgi:diaminopimelate epimerase